MPTVRSLIAIEQKTNRQIDRRKNMIKDITEFCSNDQLQILQNALYFFYIFIINKKSHFF